MPLDEKGRKKRASKAGKASGKARSAGKKQRDADICRAFAYLEKIPQSRTDKEKAWEFLKRHNSENLKDGEHALRKLSEITGLTRERVRQIVKKAKKQV